MSRAFEELAHESTSMGEISLRRRLEPTLDVDVFEVKLGDEFLMSSLFTVGERALAEIGLEACSRSRLDVVVGGLGLGYTARRVLDDPRVASLYVVDALAEVIDWHRRGLVPLGGELTEDRRCHFVHGDFFATVATGAPFGDAPAMVDTVLLDVDHSPRHVLHPSHAAFYGPAGLALLAARLRPGGVFALWSNDPPDDAFLAVLDDQFATVEARVVTFPNFYQSRDASSTIYTALVDG